ncbi:hypothetical protein GPECTOR_2g1016 [Gonium pectorale]|uniref:Protein kinase domain-containing protein n=1 Tax=Gonium pectorale TaxID=33097 RepID=A0A150GZX2_GONPE|nr:hypothetical protein GPECTOR_2g1016 [Gonium pectorale]|eukprot:KXZ55467.1 hypothetical protein GPECTOR_2g1016 [Gonium pectorale]
MALQSSQVLEPTLDSTCCKVTKVIGKGGFAHVFSVRLESAGSNVRAALKNLVRCLGLYRVPAHFPGVGPLPEPTWGMLLEYCEGGTLRDRVITSMTNGRRSYSDDAALSWLLDVAEALLFLHSASPPVIHRDIKAENVLLAAAPGGGGGARGGGGGGARAKLADLGLHVRIEEDRATMLRRKATADGASFVAITPAASECRYPAFAGDDGDIEGEDGCLREDPDGDGAYSVDGDSHASPVAAPGPNSVA